MREQQAVAPEPEAQSERVREAVAALPGRVLALQRSAGNRAARRMLARLVSTTADWMTVVPDADTGAYAISKLKDGKQVIEYGKKPKPKPKKKKKTDPEPPPDPVPPPITADQQKQIDAACQAVADARAKLAQPVATGGINSNQGKKWAGTWWTRYTAMAKKYRPPTPTKKDPTPADPRSAEEKAAYESSKAYDAWLTGVSKATTATSSIGDRLFLDIAGLEGGTDSINVYDSQIVTWGGGLGGASGAVPNAMKLVADSKATGGGKVVGDEVTRILHDAGIGFGTSAAGATEFVVCDPASKRKYRGDSALHLIKADNRLLMLFTSIARGELPGVAPDPALTDATRKAVFDAQKDFFLNRYRGGDFGAAIKQVGSTWPYDSIMMVLHLEWWGVSHWSQFKDTGGDMKKIIKKAFELYKGYVETRNGAHVAKRDLAAHLQNFGGASSAACWGPLVQIATKDLEKDAYYAEIKPAVEHKDAVPEVKNAKGKVIKKGTPEVKAQDPTYRKLTD
jgi:hypothetical protein